MTQFVVFCFGNRSKLIHYPSTEDQPQGQPCHESTSRPQTSPPSAFPLLLLSCHLALFRITFTHTPLLLHCKLPEDEVHVSFIFFYLTPAVSEDLGVLNEWPLK